MKRDFHRKRWLQWHPESQVAIQFKLTCRHCRAALFSFSFISVSSAGPEAGLCLYNSTVVYKQQCKISLPFLTCTLWNCFHLSFLPSLRHALFDLHLSFSHGSWACLQRHRGQAISCLFSPGSNRTGDGAGFFLPVVRNRQLVCALRNQTTGGECRFGSSLFRF